MSDLAPELERELAGFEAGRVVLRASPRATPLAGGLTNRAWRVTSAAADWVVRLGGTRDDALAIDRSAELVALSAAATHGLAPECVHAAVQRGVLVLEFVPGATWSRVQARSPAGIARIGARLRELHVLPVPPALPLVDARATIARYMAQQIATPGPVSRAVLAQRADDALREYQPRATAFCHHDVHHRNVVDAGRLVLVDWEYAGAGDPALELAAYSAYHDLEPGARAGLLAAYGPGVTAAELDRACRVFDCLQALWHDTAGTWSALDAGSRDALVGRLVRTDSMPPDAT